VPSGIWAWGEFYVSWSGLKRGFCVVGLAQETPPLLNLVG